jgi:hypothetical protein
MPFFFARREQERTREHSEGIKDKLQKMTNLLFANKRYICYVGSLYIFKMKNTL